jgi:PIN domain nuclease of toxin-antitoxin system
VRLLLDTHIVLWQLSGQRELSSAARDAIAAADELLFSVVSFAEIGLKAAVGKLVVPDSFRQTVADSGVKFLGLDVDHGLAVAQLPLHHRDPFDRLLIAQARAEQLTVVTADRQFFDYDLPVIDAA